jgi:hypothetical protein
MAIRIALFAVPIAAVAGLVLVLNGLDANAGIAVVSLGLVAVASGAALGFFADRLPELPRARHRHAHGGIRLGGIHDDRR